MIPVRIDWLGCDVDGVLTNHKLIVGGAEPLKVFDVRDGHAVMLLRRAGVIVEWITGRDDAATHMRAAELGVPVHVARDRDKGQIVGARLAASGITAEHAAFIGDDVVDVPALAAVGWPLAPYDAHAAVRRVARRVTRACGGAGVLREVAAWILARR